MLHKNFFIAQITPHYFRSTDVQDHLSDYLEDTKIFMSNFKCAFMGVVSDKKIITYPFFITTLIAIFSPTSAMEGPLKAFLGVGFPLIYPQSLLH